MRLNSIKIGVFLFSMVLSIPADGARFPNAIEKRIVVSGEAAISIAKLLGLFSSSRSSISFQLGKRDSWAVYLLKQDTEKKLWNDNNGSPARYNTAAFSTSPAPSLTIASYWLDLGTQLPERKIGYYSFGSPFLFEELDLNDPWMQLLRQLMQEHDWSSNAEQRFQRCFKSLDGIEFCIRVFGAKDYTNNIERNGYCIVFEAHIKNE